jgi:hypothetical protein
VTLHSGTDARPDFDLAGSDHWPWGEPVHPGDVAADDGDAEARRLSEAIRFRDPAIRFRDPRGEPIEYRVLLRTPAGRYVLVGAVAADPCGDDDDPLPAVHAEVSRGVARRLLLNQAGCPAERLPADLRALTGPADLAPPAGPPPSPAAAGSDTPAGAAVAADQAEAPGNDDLTCTQRDILHGASSLEAFARSNAHTLPEILKAGGIKASEDSRHIRKAVEVLRERGLLDARRGSNGGHWITREGRQAIGR